MSYKRDDGLVIVDSTKCTKCKSCVDARLTRAPKMVEESELKDSKKAEVLKPERDTKTRLHYLNIPKKFMASTVYDPVKKDVVIGVTCALSYNSIKLTTTTESFGDFWFEGLEAGIFSLEIDKDGKPRK